MASRSLGSVREAGNLQVSLTLTDTPAAGSTLLAFFAARNVNAVGAADIVADVGSTLGIEFRKDHTTYDVGGGQNERIEWWRADNVTVGSAPTVTGNYALTDYSQNAVMGVIEVTGNDPSAPTEYSTPTRTASGTAYGTGATGTLTADGGTALAILAARGDGVAHTVTNPSGFSTLVDQVDTSGSAPNDLLRIASDDTISGTSALSGTFTFGTGPTFGACAAMVYLPPTATGSNVTANAQIDLTEAYEGTEPENPGPVDPPPVATAAAALIALIDAFNGTDAAARRNVTVNLLPKLDAIFAALRAWVIEVEGRLGDLE